MNRVILLVVVALAAVLAALMGYWTDRTFFQDGWKQAFWLLIGAIVTVLILEKVLEIDAASTRRNEDRFALRVFCANLLNMILEMTNVSAGSGDELMPGAISGSREFPERYARIARLVSEARDMRVDVYEKIYSDVASELRRLANQYIRLYANSREEMITFYKALLSLASRWHYREELTGAYQAYTARLQHDPATQQDRIAATGNARIECHALASDTALMLSDIVERACKGTRV